MGRKGELNAFVYSTDQEAGDAAHVKRGRTTSDLPEFHLKQTALPATMRSPPLSAACIYKSETPLTPKLCSLPIEVRGPLDPTSLIFFLQELRWPHGPIVLLLAHSLLVGR